MEAIWLYDVMVRNWVNSQWVTDTLSAANAAEMRNYPVCTRPLGVLLWCGVTSECQWRAPNVYKAARPRPAWGQNEASLTAAKLAPANWCVH